VIDPRNPRGLPVSHPADAERFGLGEPVQRDPGGPSFLRAAVWVVLACALFAAAALPAGAVTGCDGDEWEATNITAGGTTGPYTWGVADPDACTAALAWVQGWGTPGSCSVTGTAAISFSGTSDQTYQFTAMKIACTPSPPSVDLTEVQSLNLLAWGALVLVFGVGYIGGKLR
jgi:hypothetical protein